MGRAGRGPWRGPSPGPGSAPGTILLALSQARRWQVFVEHHSCKAIRGVHTSRCNLSELLLLEFNFKRGEISRNECMLSPFHSLPLHL